MLVFISSVHCMNVGGGGKEGGVDGGQKSTSRVLCSPPIFLRQGLLQNLELDNSSRLARQKGQGPAFP